MRRSVTGFLLLSEGSMCYRGRLPRCRGRLEALFRDGVDIRVMDSEHQAVFFPPVLELRGRPAADDLVSLMVLARLLQLLRTSLILVAFRTINTSRNLESRHIMQSRHVRQKSLKSN